MSSYLKFEVIVMLIPLNFNETKNKNRRIANLVKLIDF